MPLPPLHKNSGRISWDWQARRLLVRLTIAEDPEKPLLLRTWAITTEAGRAQEDFFFKLSRLVLEFDDGERQASWNLVVGPVNLRLAFINKH